MAKEDFKARGAKDDHAARCFMQIVVDRYYICRQTRMFLSFLFVKESQK